MATGDIKNNLRRLRKELQSMQYHSEVDYESLSKGISSCFLPILHYLVSDFSCELALYFAGKQYDFFGKSDLRFIEVLYKVLITEFSTKPMLTKQQFFANGFAEKKVIFVTKIIELFKSKASELSNKVKKSKLKVLKSKNNKTKNDGTNNKKTEKKSIIATPVKDKQTKFTDLENTSKELQNKKLETNKYLHSSNYISSKPVETMMNGSSSEYKINSSTSMEKDVNEKKSVSFQEPVDFVLNESHKMLGKQNDLLKSNQYNYNYYKTTLDKNEFQKKPDPLELSIIEDDTTQDSFEKFDNLKSFSTQNFQDSKSNNDQLKNKYQFSKDINFGSADIHLIDDNFSNIGILANEYGEDQPNYENKIPQAFVTKETSNRKQCLICQKNQEETNRVKSKLNKLENKLEKVLIVNNELEAKVILLETRLDILENTNRKSNHLQPDNRNMLHDVTNSFSNVSNVQQNDVLKNKSNSIESERKLMDKSPKKFYNSINLSSLNNRGGRKSPKNILDYPYEQRRSNSLNKSFEDEDTSTVSTSHLRKVSSDNWNNSFDFMCESTKSTIALLQKQIKETKLLFSKNDIEA